MSEPGEHQVGRVVCVSGSQVVMVIEPSRQDGAAPLQKGSLVKMAAPGGAIFGIVSGLSIPVPAPRPEPAATPPEVRLAELELIGEAHAGAADRPPVFRRGVSAFPALGDAVRSVSGDDLACVYAPPATSTVKIGTVHLNRSQPVLISPDDLLGKHFAILGTTGCGKSCAVSLILQRLLESHANAHVLLLDPHGEYARAFAGSAEVLGPDSLQLPYWLLNAEEISSVILGSRPQSQDGGAVSAILGELIPLAKAMLQRERHGTLHITVDTPLPYRLTDLHQLLDDAMGRLDKSESLTPYRWLKSRLEVLSADSRFAFMFGGISVQDNMVRILSRLLRIPVRGKPVTIIDLSGVPSEVLNVVVSVLCRMTFDFALWSRGAQPILLVCEEAHRYAPANPALGFEPTKEALARIAKAANTASRCASSASGRRSWRRASCRNATPPSPSG